jgi:hypothetical protein
LPARSDRAIRPRGQNRDTPVLELMPLRQAILPTPQGRADIAAFTVR